MRPGLRGPPSLVAPHPGSARATAPLPRAIAAAGGADLTPPLWPRAAAWKGPMVAWPTRSRAGPAAGRDVGGIASDREHERGHASGEVADDGR